MKSMMMKANKLIPILADSYDVKIVAFTNVTAGYSMDKCNRQRIGILYTMCKWFHFEVFKGCYSKVILVILRIECQRDSTFKIF